MRKFLGMIMLLLLTLLSSCGKSEFTVEGYFDDGITQNLRFVYATPESVTSQWIPAVDGKVKMVGKSNDLTVVYIFNAQSKFLMHLVVKNGETVTFSGKITDPFGFKLDGSELNREWSGFMSDNYSDFKSGNTSKTDKAIENYISNNPESVLSTLLLTCDYSDIESDRAKELLESISEKAKPESLLCLFGSTLKNESSASKKLVPFTIRNEKDSLVLLDPKKNRANILYFWYNTSEEDTLRTKIVKELKALSAKKSVTVADIFVNTDTAKWYRTVKNDSVKWKHYKALTGHYESSIADLNVVGENFIIVADSTGQQLYRGYDAQKVKKAVEDITDKK